MNSKGYFTLSRKLKENFLHPKNERRKFTKYEAWIYLIESAYFFCSEQMIDGKRFVVPRGYFITTVESLADDLKWDRRTTETYLKMLEKEQQIRRFKTSNSRKSCTLVKINNYNAFQLPIDDKCTLKCKLKCKSYCTLQCKLGCTLNKELKKDKVNKVIKGKEIKENERILNKIENDDFKNALSMWIDYLESYHNMKIEEPQLMHHYKILKSFPEPLKVVEYSMGKTWKTLVNPLDSKKPQEKKQFNGSDTSKPYSPV